MPKSGDCGCNKTTTKTKGATLASANPSRLGGEARSTGESQNESTPAEQRNPSSNAPVTSGPQRGEKGEYLPAQYPVRGGKIKRIDR